MISWNKEKKFFQAQPGVFTNPAMLSEIGEPTYIELQEMKVETQKSIDDEFDEMPHMEEITVTRDDLEKVKNMQVPEMQD